MKGDHDRQALLHVAGLTKFFGSLKACDSIDLTIGQGEIHALLGENGAGKSTLVKMLFGALEPSAGEIFWKSEPVTIGNPGKARALGIGMVFQHFSLFEALTAAENIVLSLNEKTPILEVAERARETSKAYGLPLDPFAHIADLSVGERQRVEIIRCLLQKPELIILDEPTSVLTPQEADKLFETLEALREEGKSILYISHRLDEVRRLCDTATILRQGRVVAHCDPRDETPASLARMMVGEDVGSVERSASSLEEGGEPVLELKGLSRKASTPFSVALEDVSLTLRGGEILGIAGVAGNGQAELFETLSGEAPDTVANRLRMFGTDCGRASITARRRRGAAFIPEERLGHGAVPLLPLSQNLFLSRHDTGEGGFTGPAGTIRSSRLRVAARRICQAMDVRKGSEDPEAAALSGGNLQKFILGRELDRRPALLVVNQPTWGVDAGAAARIRQAIIDLARSGSGVLVISQDLEELFEISDAIAVMHAGRLSAPIPIGKATFERIGLLMGGSRPEQMSKPAGEAA